MSREFGSDQRGYFHWQMRTGAEDCTQGDYEITRLWGDFLAVFAEIAYYISSAEAGDHDVDAPIWQTINQMPELQRKLSAINEYVKPFEEVAHSAVKAALKEQEEA